MSVNERMPALHELGSDDKRLLQFLEQELADEEETLLKADSSYPIWSPQNAFDAANTLLDMLNADKATHPTHVK